MGTYHIEPATLEGQTFLPGERVILTEWLDGPGSESHVMRGTFAGVLEASQGFMIVVSDDETGEDVVLAQSDVVAMDRLS